MENQNQNEIQTPQSQKTSFIRNPAFLVIFSLLVAAFLICVAYYLGKIRTTSQPQTATTSISNIVYLPPDEVPPLLPNIILEKDTVVLQNYSQIVGNKAQYTRQFVSKKSLEENFQLYKEDLKDKKWDIVNTINEADLKSLSAKKEPFFLNITISKNKISNQIIVNITLVGPKLSKLSEETKD